MSWQPLAYVGPETVLPLGSILAALGGAALLFWNYVRRAAVWFFHRFQFGKSP